MKAVNYFKALSDETRLRLVHLLLSFELNVNEVVAVLGMGQSRISRHLKILLDSDLLSSRRDGMWTFYSSATEGEGFRILESIKYLFEKDPVYHKDILHARRLLEQRSQESIRFFDSIAEDWRKLKREIIGDHDINRMIMEAVRISNQSTVVDLGCGNGDLVEVLKDSAELVIGVDKSSKMLMEAQRRFAGDGKNVQLRLGQLEHLPLREGEADLAIINMVMHHIPEPSKAIAEAYRILKKGDKFVIVDFMRHEQEQMRERYSDRWLGFDPTQVQKWLEGAGFIFEIINYFDLKKKLKGFIITSKKK